MSDKSRDHYQGQQQGQDQSGRQQQQQQQQQIEEKSLSTDYLNDKLISAGNPRPVQGGKGTRRKA